MSVTSVDAAETTSAASEPAADRKAELERLPKLYHDPAFLGMTSTQLLGAFNDNLYKQLMLLFYLSLPVADALEKTGVDTAPDPKFYQAAAFFLFALPFVLFSGVAGWISDRVVKRSVVVVSKVLEIGIMLLAMAAFYSGNFYAPLIVLFLMGSQSTLFAPSKYGILPESFRERDLPRANGLIQMTTFLAIIFGTAAAGFAKSYADEHLGGQLWIVSGCCVFIAILGTGTSLLLRNTPVARPGLEFTPQSLALSEDITSTLRRDRVLLRTLIVISAFWFLAGVVQLTINDFGMLQHELEEVGTSLLATTLAIGIAFGSVLAGRMSHEHVRPEFVTIGGLGITASMLGLVLHGLFGAGTVFPLAFPFLGSIRIDAIAGSLLFAMGTFTGFFVIPLNVLLQVRSPVEQKGRIVAAMNLFNFVGLLGSAAYYFGFAKLFEFLKMPVSWVFLTTAAIMLPLALLCRPQQTA